jgi:hypothetical protein
MFGMSGLFDSSGGDENSGAMGGGDTPQSAGSGGYQNGVGYAGPSSDPGSSNYMGGQQSSSSDPAANAAQAAEYGANADTQAAMADQTSGQVNNYPAGGNMLMAGLFSLFDSKAKRVASNQRKYSRAMAQAAIDNAQRAKDQYAQDSAIQRQGLQQSYSGRGIGESSIQQEGMQYFNDTATRKAAELDQNVTLANMGQRLTNSQISQSYAQPYMHVIGGILNMV